MVLFKRDFPCACCNGDVIYDQAAKTIRCEKPTRKHVNCTTVNTPNDPRTLKIHWERIRQ